MTGIIVMVGVKTLVCRCLCALLTVGREFGGKMSLLVAFSEG